MTLEQTATPHVERDLWLRAGTSDPVVWGEVFTGRYHVPPETMPAPATVLDLGSNIGLTLADYTYRWPDALVVGVEMDGENAALARRNAPRARVVHAAVAAQAGRRRYWKAGPPFAFKLDRAGDSQIDARALEELILTEIGGPVDLLKMDVEGTEWELLDSDRWASLVRHLLVELHNDPRMEADLASSEERIARAMAALTALGFIAVKHDAHPVAVWAVR